MAELEQENEQTAAQTGETGEGNGMIERLRIVFMLRFLFYVSRVCGEHTPRWARRAATRWRKRALRLDGIEYAFLSRGEARLFREMKQQYDPQPPPERRLLAHGEIEYCGFHVNWEHLIDPFGSPMMCLEYWRLGSDPSTTAQYEFWDATDEPIKSRTERFIDGLISGVPAEQPGPLMWRRRVRRL